MVKRKPTPVGVAIPESRSLHQPSPPAQVAAVTNELFSAPHNLPLSSSPKPDSETHENLAPTPKYTSSATTGTPSTRTFRAPQTPEELQSGYEFTRTRIPDAGTNSSLSLNCQTSSLLAADARESIHDAETNVRQSRYPHSVSATRYKRCNTSISSENLPFDLSIPEKSVGPFGSNNPYRRGNSETRISMGATEGIGDRVPTRGIVSNNTAVQSEKHFVQMTTSLSLDKQSFSEEQTSYRSPVLSENQTSQNGAPVHEGRMNPSVSSEESPVPSTLSKVRAEDCGERLTPGSIDPTKQADVKSIPPSQSYVAGYHRLGPLGNSDKRLPATPQTDVSTTTQVWPSGQESTAEIDQGAAATQPLNRTVDIDIAKLGPQRNETYQIKHFNWFDYNRRTLRRSSMLTQNTNGPCPLLALVNALILGGEDDSQSALGAALRTREQVSLGLIIESLMDDLISKGRSSELTGLPDVDELNRFLLMLHTGMTANPRLEVPAAGPPNLMDAPTSSLSLPLSLNDDVKPGTFEDTLDMRLYGAFAIPLVHGWLAPRSDPARTAFARSAKTYEDAQAVLFREEELEAKWSQNGLSLEEQHLLQDMASIKTFLEKYSTQITPYGLDTLNRSLFPGAFAILFRNSHFSTIYKHPEAGVLYTLVTDAGYSDKDEVIWESLVDVSGQDSEFFSGDFRLVGHGSDHDADVTQPTSSIPVPEPVHSNEATSPALTQDQQQQSDADFAMALQLHEEETAAQIDASQSQPSEALRNRIPSHVTPTLERHGSRQRQRQQQQQQQQQQRQPQFQLHPVRPTIPPRTSLIPPVNRPVNPDSDEHPPPAYEEAARSKPYLPPLGHPQHQSFDSQSSPLLTSQNANPSTPISSLSDSNANEGGSGSGRGRLPMSLRPVSSAFINSDDNGVSPGSVKPKDRGKDCVVM